MRVNYRLITTGDLDSRTIAAWRSIQSGCDVFRSPYFCPEFTQLVGAVRGDVRIIVIENDGHPVGFFPHQRSLLGMGKPVGGPLSDCHGVIAAPDSEWRLTDLMRAANLSVWDFDHLIGRQREFDPHVRGRADSPQMDLSRGYVQYAQGRREAGSDYIRKTEGLARKLGREAGELRFTLHETGSAVMEQLIRWKSEQYRQSGLPDAFGVRWTRDLLAGILLAQTAEFAGVCSVLRVGDRVVAAHMGMRSRDVLHYWFPVYDSEFAKFSPGIILLLRMAEALAGSGVRIIDLGKGEAQYKTRLMTGAAELREGAVELPSLLVAARQLHRVAEARAARGGMASALRLPLGAIRRIARKRKYR